MEGGKGRGGGGGGGGEGEEEVICTCVVRARRLKVLLLLIFLIIISPPKRELIKRWITLSFNNIPLDIFAGYLILNSTKRC